MAYRCSICDKGSKSGHTVSHSHIATKRKFKANLQKVNILKDGRKQKCYVCTKCLKSDKITKL